MKQALVVFAFGLVVVDAVSLTLIRSNHSHAEGVEHAVRSPTAANATAALLQEEEMPTVRHKKEAGNGYVEGSPLYDHQERRKEGATVVAPEVPQVESPIKPKHGLIGTIVYLIFIFIVAYFYRAYGFNLVGLGGGHAEIVTELAPYQGDSFTHGFCDLCRCTRDDNCIMFWACCCPGIRWSDTVSNIKVRFLKFWVALALFLFISLLGSGVAGAWVAGIFGFVLLGLGVYYRQQLRGAFGHSKGTLKTITLDILAWACCPCCAIVQEAKEVEYAFTFVK
eukprot:TRINITY_DN11728_c0_g1_i1.p1 TRINITY_DN11728_c0_g1~~TRINITY_DN11728_c0_g1_i1.p1  ORF type:complete len:280 (+),score=49.67 TRINITY_DN11728_c0_g1_i1:85-924(+)